VGSPHRLPTIAAPYDPNRPISRQRCKRQLHPTAKLKVEWDESLWHAKNQSLKRQSKTLRRKLARQITYSSPTPLYISSSHNNPTGAVRVLVKNKPNNSSTPALGLRTATRGTEVKPWSRSAPTKTLMGHQYIVSRSPESRHTLAKKSAQLWCKTAWELTQLRPVNCHTPRKRTECRRRQVSGSRAGRNEKEGSCEKKTQACALVLCISMFLCRRARPDVP